MSVLLLQTERFSIEHVLSKLSLNNDVNNFGVVVINWAPFDLALSYLSISNDVTNFGVVVKIWTFSQSSICSKLPITVIIESFEYDRF